MFLVTFPFDPKRKVAHLFACFWSQFYFYTNPLWRLRVEHRARLPKGRASVLVANHQSLGDILALSGLYHPFKWVSKASVFRAPLVGWYMSLCRYVSVVRGNKSSVRRMMERCEHWLEQGVSLMMFPEGSRSPDGEIKPFKDGAFQLAIRQGCPVVPIIVVGTSRTLPKHGLILDLRADCLVRVLEPVEPSGFAGNVTALRDHVHSIMVKEHARAQAESRQPSARQGQMGSGMSQESQRDTDLDS